MSKRLKYTVEHDRWLKNNFYKYKTTKELAEIFNETFHLNCWTQNIGKHCKALGLVRANCLPYTAEMDEWLRNNANTVPYSKLSVMFRERFGRSITKGGLIQHCNILGIFAEDPNKFNNRIPPNKLPLGTERVGRRGERLIRTEKGWEHKARYIYEKAYGIIPEKHQIIQLDGNPDNFNLDNLYCIPLQYMLMMNRNHWFTQNRELTLAAIKLCELHYTLKNDGGKT